MFVAWGEELGFLYNDAYAEILGAKHPAALGARFDDIWSEIWPDIEPLIDAAMRGEASYREDLPLVMNRRGFSEQAWFTFSYSPVRDELGAVAGMFCAVAETTSQVLARARQAFRLSLEERLHALSDPTDAMAAAAEALGRELGVARVGYGEVDEAQEFISIERDWTDGSIPSVAGRHRLRDFGPPIIDELEAGRTMSVDDVASDPRVGSAASAFAAIHTRSALVVPLIKAGRFTAKLFLHHPEPRRWSEDDRRLVEEVADRTWAAVERARAEAERQKSEVRFRALATAGTSTIYRMSPDWTELHDLDGKTFLDDDAGPDRELGGALHPPRRPGGGSPPRSPRRSAPGACSSSSTGSGSRTDRSAGPTRARCRSSTTRAGSSSGSEPRRHHRAPAGRGAPPRGGGAVPGAGREPPRARLERAGRRPRPLLQPPLVRVHRHHASRRCRGGAGRRCTTRTCSRRCSSAGATASRPASRSRWSTRSAGRTAPSAGSSPGCGRCATRRARWSPGSARTPTSTSSAGRPPRSRRRSRRGTPSSRSPATS